MCNNATIIFAVVNPGTCTFILEHLGGETSEATTILTQGWCENASAVVEMGKLKERKNNKRYILYMFFFQCEHALLSIFSNVVVETDYH